MNARLLALLLVLPPAATRAGDASGTIRFSNRNQLSGHLEALSPERLVWNSPALDHPADFHLDQVLDITLPAETPETDAGYNAVLNLTNGDQLHGRLAAVTDQEISLDTWYAGKLTIRRPMVASLKIVPRPKLLYHGPDSLNGWLHSNRGDGKAWIYENRAFHSTGPGGIGRDLALPERCRIAFDLAWRSNLRLRLAVFADKPEPESPANACELIWQRRYVQFRKRWSVNGRSDTSYLGQANVPEGTEHEKARVELYCDREKGVYNLVVDGRSAALWNDPEPRAGKPGGALHFIAEDATPLHIARLEITDWDGIVENPPDDEDLEANEEREKQAAADADAEKAGGLMKLRNGDLLPGEALWIRDGVMRVKTPFAEIDLPVARLRTINLKPAEYDEAKWNRGDIRAWLPDGGRITFRLDRAAPGTLTGYSQNFGTATFRTNAFSRLDFNLYNPDLDPLRAEPRGATQR